MEFGRWSGTGGLRCRDWLRILECTKADKWKNLENLFEKSSHIGLFSLGKCRFLRHVIVFEMATFGLDGSFYKGMLKPCHMSSVESSARRYKPLSPNPKNPFFEVGIDSITYTISLTYIDFGEIVIFTGITREYIDARA